jgi:hypothetical protein
MNKWKDTARTTVEITKFFTKNEKTVIPINTLAIVEKEISEGLYFVTDSNPRKSARRKYKVKLSEIKIEDYAVTRDINIQMLLADGWDAQDLLNSEYRIKSI